MHFYDFEYIPLILSLLEFQIIVTRNALVFLAPPILSIKISSTSSLISSEMKAHLIYNLLFSYGQGGINQKSWLTE